MADLDAILSDHEKLEIANTRIQQFARDAYNHKLNKQSLLAGDPAADTQAQDKAIAEITIAIEDAVRAVEGIDLPVNDESPIAKARAVFPDKTPKGLKAER